MVGMVLRPSPHPEDRRPLRFGRTDAGHCGAARVRVVRVDGHPGSLGLRRRVPLTPWRMAVEPAVVDHVRLGDRRAAGRRVHAVDGAASDHGSAVLRHRRLPGRLAARDLRGRAAGHTHRGDGTELEPAAAVRRSRCARPREAHGGLA